MYCTNNMRSNNTCYHLLGKLKLLFESDLLEQIPMLELLKLIIMFIKSIIILVRRNRISKSMYMVIGNLLELNLYRTFHIFYDRHRLHRSLNWLSH